MQVFDFRWFLVAVAAIALLHPLGFLGGWLGVWLSQVVLEIALFAAAFALVGRAAWPVALGRMGWVRSQLSRRHQAASISLGLMLVVTAGLLLSGEPLPIARGPIFATPLARAALFLSLVPLTVLSEEMLFRGALQRSLTTRFGAPIGVMTASLLFALLHFGAGPEAMAFALILGLCLGLITHRSGSIHEAIVIHGLNNTAYFWNLLS